MTFFDCVDGFCDKCSGDHPELHYLTHSVPALLSAVHAAGLDTSSRDFLRAFHLAIDQQRPALYRASDKEMSEAEAAAYEAGGFDLTPRERDEIGRAHVCTPVTNAHLVCRLLLEKKK